LYLYTAASFEMNSEHHTSHHTGARPSVRLCVGPEPVTEKTERPARFL
jgi:hypothetical protein